MARNKNSESFSRFEVERKLEQISADEKKAFWKRNIIPIILFITGLGWIIVSYFFALKYTTQADAAKKDALAFKDSTQIYQDSSAFFQDSIKKSSDLVANFSEKIDSVKNKYSTLTNLLLESTERLKLQAEILRQERNTLEAKKNDLLVEIEGLKEIRKNLSTEKQSLQLAYAEIDKAYKDVRSDNRKIIPRSSAQPIPGRFTKAGCQMYEFKCWIEAEISVLNKINQVTYYYTDATFKYPVIKVSDSNGGFLTTYNGWGCVELLPIIIEFKDDSPKKSISFDMCTHLDENIPSKHGYRCQEVGSIR